MQIRKWEGMDMRVRPNNKKEGEARSILSDIQRGPMPSKQLASTEGVLQGNVFRGHLLAYRKLSSAASQRKDTNLHGTEGKYNGGQLKRRDFV
jgi:hypothetical protein